jgi:hypothetical protein
LIGGALEPDDFGRNRKAISSKVLNPPLIKGRLYGKQLQVFVLSDFLDANRHLLLLRSKMRHGRKAAT